jgi:hypothetical protein
MDELFTRYMYYERAKQGNRNTTTEALRDFYEKDDYKLLKSNETLQNLESLANFWQSVDNQDGFTDDVLKRLFVLNYAPNGMWTYLVSVYFLKYRNNTGELEDGPFCDFLDLITAFIWAYAVERPGVNALRTPVYPEMINIVNGTKVTFEKHRFNKESIKSQFINYKFTNGRPITKSMLSWWAFTNNDQNILEPDVKYEIEHIFAKKRADIENSLKNPGNLEALGNKAILEKRINIRASDYRFEDKKKYYKGYTDSKGHYKNGTHDQELIKIADTHDDFTEADIELRTNCIIDTFIGFLDKTNLLETD